MWSTPLSFCNQLTFSTVAPLISSETPVANKRALTYPSSLEPSTHNLLCSVFLVHFYKDLSYHHGYWDIIHLIMPSSRNCHCSPLNKCWGHSKPSTHWEMPNSFPHCENTLLTENSRHTWNLIPSFSPKHVALSTDLQTKYSHAVIVFQIPCSPAQKLIRYCLTVETIFSWIYTNVTCRIVTVQHLQWFSW